MTPPAATTIGEQPSPARDEAPRRWALGSGPAFWLVAGMLFVLLLASGAPAPLYRVYQVEWHFSETTLTEVFAVYAVVLLVTLLFCGSLSDYVGRKPLIAGGLVFGAAACVVFLVAGGVGALYVARSLQGVSVGLATGALGARCSNWSPRDAGARPS